jgi:hypothetical protein
MRSITKALKLADDSQAPSSGNSGHKARIATAVEACRYKINVDQYLLVDWVNQRIINASFI